MDKNILLIIATQFGMQKLWAYQRFCVVGVFLKIVWKMSGFYLRHWIDLLLPRDIGASEEHAPFDKNTNVTHIRTKKTKPLSAQFDQKCQEKIGYHLQSPKSENRSMHVNEILCTNHRMIPHKSMHKTVVVLPFGCLFEYEGENAL